MTMNFSKGICNVLLVLPVLKNWYMLIPLSPHMKPKKQIQQREDSAAQLFKCKEMEIPAVRLYSCPFFKTIEQNKADQKLMKVPAE